MKNNIKIANNFLSNKGFTLIELMTVMAIVAILATTIIVSLSSHKKRAEGAKALTELSGVMQNIYLCIADEGNIIAPVNTGGNICSLGAGYGFWPVLSNNLSNFTYHSSNFAVQPWYYSADNAVDNVHICCNSTSGKCQKFDGAHICTAVEALQ